MWSNSDERAWVETRSYVYGTRRWKGVSQRGGSGDEGAPGEEKGVRSVGVGLSLFSLFRRVPSPSKQVGVRQRLCGVACSVTGLFSVR
jgi:hypothetical protein